MEALILFLWKSIVISGLLTGWYWLGLRGRRLHQYNRFFLLSILFVSLMVPFLHFSLFTMPHFAKTGLAPVALAVRSVSNAAGSAPVADSAVTTFNWPAIAGGVAISISLALFSVLGVRIIKLRRMCRQYPAKEIDGVDLILTDSPKAPFTFLMYLFWNNSIPLENEVGRVIFRHELAHIRQGHTYDKLICQALTCICWFNPFYWIIQKELNIVHEFIADEHAVTDRDTETFALMLLHSYSNGSYLAPQHHFFSSPVKRRLSMLQASAEPSYTMVRRFMAVPLIVGSVLLFSFNGHDVSPGHIAPAKKKITVLLDAGHGGNDAGERNGKYSESQIALQYAKRIQQLAPAYNIEVKLTRDNDRDIQLADRVAIADRTKPDVFISLHLGEEAPAQKEKGDLDIYVSGDNEHAAQSSSYSSAIFGNLQEMGIIPGAAKATAHKHSPGCNCNNCTAQATSGTQAIERNGVYVLKHAHTPAMIMVLGNMKDEAAMKELTDDDRRDKLGNAILQGIVDGAADRPRVSQNPLNSWAQPACGTPPPACK